MSAKRTAAWVATMILVTGCTGNVHVTQRNSQQSESVACRQAYATYFIFGWRPLSNLLARRSCGQAMEWQATVWGARSLVPMGMVTVPRLRTPRHLACRNAMSIIRSFDLGFTRPTCNEAEYITDVLPVTSCDARSLPRQSGVLAGSVISGWNEPGMAVTTSVWIGEEDGQAIQIWAGSPTAIFKNRGFLIVTVAKPCEIEVATDNPNISKVAGLDGFTAGNFYTPSGVGRIILIQVSGSLEKHTMIIRFKYHGGRGSINPIAGKWVLTH